MAEQAKRRATYNELLENELNVEFSEDIINDIKWSFGEVPWRQPDNKAELKENEDTLRKLYEELPSSGEEERVALRKLATAEVSADELAEIKRRAKYAANASPSELAWLKLRAYYLGLQKARQNYNVEAASSPSPSSSLMPSSTRSNLLSFRPNENDANEIALRGIEAETTVKAVQKTEKDVQTRASRRAYNPEYTQHLKLTREYREWRHTQRSAFQVSLLSVFGIAALRWLNRRKAGGKQAIK